MILISPEEVKTHHKFFFYKLKHSIFISIRTEMIK